MKVVGCFVGKFLPPHIGHLSVIEQALHECDEVVVVLADNPEKSKKLCDESGFPYFSGEKRLSWIKAHFKEYNKIKYFYFNESNLNDMESWAKEFKKQLPYKINVKYADESYRLLNEKYFPECTFVPIDRERIRIHGTDIRKNKNLIKYMVKEGQEDVFNQLNKEKTNG